MVAWLPRVPDAVVVVHYRSQDANTTSATNAPTVVVLLEDREWPFTTFSAEDLSSLLRSRPCPTAPALDDRRETPPPRIPAGRAPAWCGRRLGAYRKRAVHY